MSEVTVGTRVEVTAKGIKGKVAFVGTTDFASGKWVGVELDEPKGKNNGSVQGKAYFTCGDGYGIFVRQNQVVPVDEKLKFKGSKSPKTSMSPASSTLSAEDYKVKRSSKPHMSQAQRRNQLTSFSGASLLPLSKLKAGERKVTGIPYMKLVESPCKPHLTSMLATNTEGTSTATFRHDGTDSKRAKCGRIIPTICITPVKEQNSKQPQMLLTSKVSNLSLIKANFNNSQSKIRPLATHDTLGSVGKLHEKSRQGLTSTVKKEQISLNYATPSKDLDYNPGAPVLKPSTTPQLFLNTKRQIGSNNPYKQLHDSIIESLGAQKNSKKTAQISLGSKAYPNYCFTTEMSRSQPSGAVSEMEKLPAGVQPQLMDCTRLPVAGSRTDSAAAQKSLQTTPSGSRSSLTTSSITKAEITNLGKRSSFVEPNFAEKEKEIVPQYTPGTPASLMTTPVSTPNMFSSSASDRFNDLQVIESLRNEVKDLSEKLDIIKAKRSTDQEKLRDMDRMRLEVETLSEFKTKVLEAQASLQRDLKKAKFDAREAIEAKERHAEEMQELSEAVEMATLDKEMAEERAETLQLELEQACEQLDTLKTELNTLKEETTGRVSLDSGALTAIEIKQLQAENSRLREALVKLRDSSAHERHQHQKNLKDFEQLKAEHKDLMRDRDSLSSRCEELVEQVNDLQEQTDAALGAEEMVENLTEKNLNLEEKVSQLNEAVADLEALQDVNDQLQDSAKELEMQLREELQQSIVKIQQTLKERDAIVETLADHNTTILRFRDLVQKLRDENILLRKNLEEESSKSIPGLSEAMDFKKVFEETKAQTTAIDLEIRRLEAKEAALHVEYLSSFMPEGFMKRGGDHDSLLVLLMIPRMICKVEILLGQVRDKLIPSSITDTTRLNFDEMDSSDVERYSFCCHLCFLLYSLMSNLHRWKTALNTCSPEKFLSVGMLYSELIVQEKMVDFYLELLRKSQLDENIPFEGLEKCILVFQHMYSVNLSEELIENSILASDTCLSSVSACDCVVVDASRLLSLMNKSQKDANVSIMLQDIRTIAESIRQFAKKTRRYLPDPPKQPPINNKLQSQLLNDSLALAKVVKILHEACKQGLSHCGMLSSENDLPSTKIEEFLQHAMEKCDSHVEGASSIKEVMKDWVTTSLMTMTDLAQVVNEAPIKPKEKPPTPLSIRAQAVKAELDQTKNLKIQLEDKETTIKEIKKVLRAKQEELSEASIRKELAEKKLANANKDSEMTIEKLSRKLEDVQNVLHRKEREFEATLEHFQSDIESLESEKGELKEKLMSVSKRTLFEGLSRSAAVTPIQSPAHGSFSSSSQSSVVSPTGPLAEGLIEYTRHLQREVWRLRSAELVKSIKSLPNYSLPNYHENAKEIEELENELCSIRIENNKINFSSLRIKLDNNIHEARKRYLIYNNEKKKEPLKERLAMLKCKVAKKVADREEEGPSKRFGTYLPEERPDSKPVQKVAEIKLPGWETCRTKKRIVLSVSQLARIHQLLAPKA